MRFTHRAVGLTGEGRRSFAVGVADCKVTNDREAELVTYGLGSCVAVVVHDPTALVGGLLHLMLADSRLDPDKARENPYVFADKGVPRLFHEAYALGAQKARLSTRIAGGACTQGLGLGMGEIGKNNVLAVKKILWKAGVLIDQEDSGGNRPREVRLDIASGRFQVR